MCSQCLSGLEDRCAGALDQSSILFQLWLPAYYMSQWILCSSFFSEFWVYCGFWLFLVVLLFYFFLFPVLWYRFCSLMWVCVLYFLKIVYDKTKEQKITIREKTLRCLDVRDRAVGFRWAQINLMQWRKGYRIFLTIGWIGLYVAPAKKKGVTLTLEFPSGQLPNQLLEQLTENGRG